MLLAVGVIVLISALTQSVTGFGVAIVGMPLLHFTNLPSSYAAPLIALVALIMRPLMLWHYWRAFELRAMWRLGLASVAGIPLGVMAVTYLDEGVVTALLGIVLIVYALYSAYYDVLHRHAVRPQLGENWAWGLGFIAGLLGGAYNIFGPPSVIYAKGRGWQAHTFKANLQAFAMLNSVFITLAHGAKGNFTPEVLALGLVGVPAAMLGLVLGYWLERFIDQARFTRIVIVMMFVMGLGLLF